MIISWILLSQPGSPRTCLVPNIDIRHWVITDYPTFGFCKYYQGRHTGNIIMVQKWFSPFNTLLYRSGKITLDFFIFFLQEYYWGITGVLCVSFLQFIGFSLNKHSVDIWNINVQIRSVFFYVSVLTLQRAHDTNPSLQDPDWFGHDEMWLGLDCGHGACHGMTQYIT